MNGAEVYNILEQHGVKHLHHANTVATSCTFLANRYLASRGWVEYFGLPQTPQYSDDKDKQFGIWNDVFTDGVDIHARASRRNQYGPVLFRLPLHALLTAPPGTSVMVTKRNPVKWLVGETDAVRYFLGQEELSAGYQYGTFDYHVVFRAPGWVLPFATFPVEIILDNPGMALSSGVDAYQGAIGKLHAAAAASEAPIAITIAERACDLTCKCRAGLSSSYAHQNLDALF